MADVNLDLVLTVEDQYSRQLADLQAKIDALEGELKSAAASADKASGSFQKMASDATKGFKDAVASSTALAASLAAFSAGAVVAGQKLLGYSMDLEQTRVGYGVLLGNTEKAKAFLEDLNDFGLRTPFTITGLRDTAKQLLAYGTTARDVIPTAEMLGDLSMGNEQTFKRLAYAYGQVQAAGKLYGSELRQFTETGIPLIDQLADHFGVVPGAIREMVEKGKVSFADVKAAMKDMTSEGGMFYKMMEEGAKTLPGILANIEDAWVKMMEGFVDTKAYDLLKQAASGFFDWFQAQIPVVTKAINDMSDWLLKNGETIKTVAIALAGALTPAVIAAAGAIATMVARLAPFASLAIVIQKSIEMLGEAWRNNFMGMRDIILGIWNAVKPVVDMLVGLFQQFSGTIGMILTVFGALQAASMLLIPAIAAIGTAFTGAITSITGATTAAMVMNPALLAIVVAVGAVVGAFALMSAGLNTVASESNTLAQNSQVLAQQLLAVRDATAAQNAEFSNLTNAQMQSANATTYAAQKINDYAQTTSNVNERILNLIGLEGEKSRVAREAAEAAVASAERQQQALQELASKQSATTQIMMNNTKTLYEAQNKMSEKEFDTRIAMWEKEVNAERKSLQERVRNQEISRDQAVSIFESRAGAYEQMLRDELAYEGTISNGKLAILSSWGQNNIEMRKIVTQFDATQLNERLKMAQQWSISDAKLVANLVKYKADLGNNELKAYGNMLSKQEKAANQLKANLAQIFNKPILQEIRIAGDSFAQKLVSGLSSIGDTAARVFNQVTQVVGNYNMQIDAAQAEFDATVEQIAAAGDAGAGAIDKMKNGKGGGGGKDGKSELEKLKKQAEELKEAQTKLAEEYDKSQVTIGDTLQKLSDDHAKSFKKLQDDIDKSRETLGKLKTEYNSFVTGQGNSFGDAVVNAQKDLSKTAGELWNAQMQLSQLQDDINYTGGSDDKRRQRDELSRTIAELQQKEKAQRAAVDSITQYTTASKEQEIAKVQELEALYAQTKSQLEQTQDIQQQARLQVDLENYQRQIDYKKIRLENFTEEQKTMLMGIERATRDSQKSDLELFLQNMQDKRIAADKEFKDKVKLEEDKIAVTYKAMHDEINLYAYRTREVHTHLTVMKTQHSMIMSDITKQTKKEIDEQIKMYGQLEEAAKRAAQASYTAGVQRKYQGGVIETHASGGVAGGVFNPRSIGSDTVPALLTPGEIVLNAAQQRNLAGNLQNGKSEVHVHVDRLYGNKELVMEFADEIVKQLTYNGYV